MDRIIDQCRDLVGNRGGQIDDAGLNPALKCGIGDLRHSDPLSKLLYFAETFSRHTGFNTNRCHTSGTDKDTHLALGRFKASL